MRIWIIPALILLGLSTQAHARKSGYSYASASFKFNEYADILNETSDQSQRVDLAPDLSLSLEIRLYRLFSLVLVGGQSIDSSRTLFGAGIRADLPGIFFFGGSVNDLIHRKRRRGVSSYFTYQAMVLRTPDETSSQGAERFALGLDIDITDWIYWTIEPAIYSQDGNRFFSAGLGLGIEF